MPLPFAAAASMPLLAGAGVPGITAAAGGAAAGGLGATLAGAGTALGGLGSLFGAFGGGGGGQQDYSSLYAQLAPINTMLTYAGQELMGNMAPYFGAEAAQTNLLGQSVYDAYKTGVSKANQLAGLQTGIASQLLAAGASKQELASKGKTAMELLGGETQAEMAKKGADALGLQYNTLAKGLTDVGTNAATTRNAQVMATTQANLETGKQLAAIRGQTEAMLAGRREARGAALTPMFA